MDLWAKAQPCFSQDDGSYPEVVLDQVPASHLGQPFAFLRNHSKSVSGLMWVPSRATDVDIASMPDPVRVVLEEETHLCARFEETRFAGQLIPTLGLFVQPAIVTIFFRMGKEWELPHVIAFFQLLKEITKQVPGCQIRTHGWDHASGFMEVWSEVISRESRLVKDVQNE